MRFERPKILLATRSSGKLRELSEILADFELNVIDLGAAGITQSAEEDAIESFPTFEENPDFYIDFGETGPYVVETGASECAT